jgi:hypothetical protein
MGSTPRRRSRCRQVRDDRTIGAVVATVCSADEYEGCCTGAGKCARDEGRRIDVAAGWTQPLQVRGADTQRRRDVLAAAARREHDFVRRPAEHACGRGEHLDGPNRVQRLDTLEHDHEHAGYWQNSRLLSWRPVTERRHDRVMKPVALALLVVQLVAMIAVFPESPFAHPFEPTYIAGLSSIVVGLVLGVTRFVASPPWLDRLVLALFLAGMPIVYTWCAILRGDASALALESAGIVAFGGAAILGYTRMPWLIGAGIIAHGVVWDALHHGRTSYVPDWYCTGCLLVDLGLGVFALLCLRRAPESAHPMSRQDLVPRLGR